MTICTLLRCPLIDEETFKAFSKRLQVTQELFAVGKVSYQYEDSGQPPAQSKDLLDTRIISDDDEDPAVAIGFREDVTLGDAQRYIYVLWKTKVHIGQSSVSDPLRIR